MVHSIRQGLIKVIPIANSLGNCQLKEAFNLRVEEPHLIDMCFIYNRNASAGASSSASSSSSSSDPWACNNTIAILYEDMKQNR